MAEEKPGRVTVRTTMRPDLDVEMSATEAEDLRRQGLLVPVAEQEQTPAPQEPENVPAARSSRKGENR